MIRILITGADGQLGSELNFLSNRYDSMELVLTNARELNITDEAVVNKTITEGNFDYCVNCAAYTAVDKAEQDKQLAYAVNETGAAYLAKACKENNVKLIHVSTDFVFDGELSRPYKEGDQLNPLGVYGASKAAGEQAVLQADSTAIILRTSWLYSSYGANFVKTMQKLGADRDKLTVIYDQVGTPTYARDLAAVILRMIDNDKAKALSGIFHYSNEGVASWYDFAVAIMRMSNLSCEVSPINTYEYPTPAKRPAFSILDKRKIKEALDLTIPHWEDSLAECIETLKHTRDAN